MDINTYLSAQYLIDQLLLHKIILTYISAKLNNIRISKCEVGQIEEQLLQADKIINNLTIQSRKGVIQSHVEKIG